MTATKLAKAIWKSLDYHTAATIMAAKTNHKSAFDLRALCRAGLATPKATAILPLTRLWEELEKIREERAAKRLTDTL